MINDKWLQSICRICLAQTNDLKPIVEHMQLLLSFAFVNVKESDDLPQHICSICLQQANQAHRFRVLCQQSDTTLRDYIKELETNETQPGTSCGTAECKLNGSNKTTVRDDREENLPDSINETEGKRIENQDVVRKGTDTSKYTCRFCSFHCAQLLRLYKHERTHGKGLQCRTCGKSVASYKSLRVHVNLHRRHGAYLCPTCGKVFTLPENFKRHVRIHSGELPFKCTKCEKTFAQSNQLKSHHLTHTSDTPHLCSTCGSKFKRKTSLRRHDKVKHSPALLRTHVCSICDRRFSEKKGLNRHLKTHSGEKDFICGVCSKAFGRACNLKVHEKIHNGDKPHACCICRRAFIQKHVLQSHMKTHVNE